MLNDKFYILVLSSISLFGCGEEFYTVGVSIGGSGTGGGEATGTVPSNGPLLSDPGDAGLPAPDPVPIPIEFIDANSAFFTYVPAPVVQTCHGIERKIQFQDLQTGELFEDYSEILLQNPAENSTANLALRLTIKNLNQNNIFEYIPECSSPVHVIGSDGSILQQKDYFSCPDQEQIHVIKPFESKVYKYEFTLPQQQSSWTIKYDTKYSIGTLDNFIQCSSLDLPIDVMMKF